MNVGKIAQNNDSNKEVQDAPDMPSCRLYLLLARDAPIGVIFRRGPSKRVQVIQWNTANDTFTPGQWFHGRIYEKLSDLSPNGKLLLYPAHQNSARTRLDAEVGTSWIAISKPPYLTALELWPAIVGAGGYFSSNSKVLLTDVWRSHRVGDKRYPDHSPHRLSVEVSTSGVAEEDLLSLRLVRNGWLQAQKLRQEFARSHDRYSGYVTIIPGIRHKKSSCGEQTLTMTTTVSGFKTHEHYSVQYAEGKEYQLTGALWADWDHFGRLAYVRQGKLFAATFGERELEWEHELADFNGNQPYTMAAPDWAKTW